MQRAIMQPGLVHKRVWDPHRTLNVVDKNLKYSQKALGNITQMALLVNKIM